MGGVAGLKRIGFLCALSALLLLFGCGADRGTPLQQPPAPQSESSSMGEQESSPWRLRLAVSEGDVLNPYRMTSQLNADVSALLYDPLIKLDASFAPRGYLVQEPLLEGTVCTLRLRDGVTFGDGSPLTAQDAAYSYTLAAARDTAGRFSNVESCKAQDESTLVFTLKRADRYFLNLLTFPIIKSGSGAEDTPPGTGRYRVGEDGSLIQNSGHFEGGSRVENIILVPVGDADEIGYDLITDRIDYARRPKGSAQPEASGSVPVQENTLVYLGFNGSIYPSDNGDFRRAVDAILDRSAIVSQSFSGRAAAAPEPVNPTFYDARGEPRELPDPDALLDSMGLDQRDAEGYRTRGGAAFEVQLAINVESTAKRDAAALLRQQFAAHGLHLTINEYSFEQFTAQIAAGGYNLYLGEVRLPEDMDLSALLSPQGALHHHLPDTDELYQSYLLSREGALSMEDFYNRFWQQCPFVPLLYTQSVISHSRNFYPAVVATDQDIFYNISKW